MISQDTIVQRIKDRVANLPAEVTDGMIRTYVDDALSDVSAWQNSDVNPSDIPSNLQSTITAIGELYLRSRLTGVGVDFNIVQGEFTLSRGQESTMHFQEVQFLAQRADNLLKRLGRPIKYARTY